MSDRADVSIARHLATRGYHPRSSRHGDAVCEFFAADLYSGCSAFRQAADAGRIVAKPNFTIDPESVDRWNADLVVGPPVDGAAESGKKCGPLTVGMPREVWMAVDTKTIMTEHGKARRNRQRDLNAFQDILHRKNRSTVVLGLLVVNMAPRFKTPLARSKKGPTEHRSVERLVEEIVAMMRGLAHSDAEGTKPGIEGLGVVVVSHTNMKGDVSRLVTELPAPTEDDPVSYSSLLRDACAAFTARFGRT